MNTERPAFIDKQYEFAAHIRDPSRNVKPEEIETRRMAIYNDLFFRNIEGFIASGFPVLRQLYNDDDWTTLVRSFIAEHKSRSPYFLHIAEEFLTFLQQEHRSRDCDPPFMLELAHYEWVELALMVTDTTVDMSQIDANADLLSGRPILSPLAWPLSYRWPVHQLSPRYRPDTPPAQVTHVVVFRDRSNQVRFVIINPVTARLLALLQENSDYTGAAALRQIANELAHPNPETVLAGGQQALEQLKSQGIVLGARRLPGNIE